MDIDKIFESVQSELLTEDVKKKISTLIEAKVNEKTNEKINELEGLFEEYKEKELDKLEEKAVEYVDEYLVDKIDEYMDYVADEYVKENALQIEDGLKATMYENIVKSVKKVMSENQIREDEVESNTTAVEKSKELSDELDKAIKENMELKRKIKGNSALIAFNEVAEGLTEEQKETLQSLSEDFDIDDVEEFKEKVETLKESIVSSKGDSETLEEADETLEESVNYDMELTERDSSHVWDDFKGQTEYL